MSTLASVIVRDVFANRPAAGSAGKLFFSTDTGLAYRDNGTTWDLITTAAALPLTTKGDLYTHSTVDARLPVGTDGQRLVADSTQAVGIGWASSPFLIPCSLVGKPAVGAIVLIFTATRAVNFTANFGGSYGTVGANATGTSVYAVLKNGSSIGSVSISTGGVFTFTTPGGTAQSLAAGDRLTITAPNPQDATLSDVGFTLAGTR